jgi:RNA polymerase sigma factor (sigma-70 family)
VSTRATPNQTTPFAEFMEHAEPVLPETLPREERFAFSDVPRLSAALKRGEDAAFVWLHGQWGRRINRYAFALAAGDGTFAAEIAQATWLRIVRHMRVLGDEAALWSWIVCAARHAATDLRRKGGRYLRALHCFAEWWSHPAEAARDEQADSLLAALEAALLKLTEGERALIAGRYFSGESLDAIGARHALSTRAIEGRLARVRQRLRELIAEQLQSTPS